MNTRLCATIAMAVLGLSAAAMTQQAEACGPSLVRTANGQWKLAPPAKMTASAARRMFLAAAPATHKKAMPNPLQYLAPIAGLYQVYFYANDPYLPPHYVVDHAYVQWHADGTEIENSYRPAGDGNFCLGTWAQTGKRTYQLNHFMLPWAQSLNRDGVDIDSTFVGPAGLQETITLAKDGQSYTGTFVLTFYDTNYNIITPGGVPITGTVKGTRETIDSPVTF